MLCQLRAIDTEGAFLFLEEQMDRYCGCEYTVRDVDYSLSKQTYKYRLEGNGDNTLNNIIWCSGCLAPVAEEFSEPNQSELDARFDALLLP